MKNFYRLRKRLAALWPRRSSLKTEPGAALFRHLRIRLTLWYCAVLGCALLLFCVLLYFGTSRLLYAPTEQSVPQEVFGLVDFWQHNPAFNCTPPAPRQREPGAPDTRHIFNNINNSSYFACYNSQQQLIHPSQESLPTKFVSANPLVQQTFQTRSPQSGIIDSSSAQGRIYCEAAPVFDLQSHALIGLVLVGHPLAELDNAVNSLLSLLVIVGAIVLLGAGLGGLFLANRALQPTREAFTRQQRFIADASHELRTPLTFLCANTEILLDGRDRLDPDDVTLLEDIYSEANHMNALANNMLALARLDADESHLHREHDVVDLSKLAERLARQGEAAAQKHGIQVHFESAGPAPVIGDPVLLEQAALVLLDNALKYNRPNGSVRVNTFLSNSRAFLSVHDTGIGIAPKHLSRLGERFYRADKARSRAVGGTGLGLSIAYGIAQAHNGSLEVTSTVHVGTTAILSLPALPSSPSRDTHGKPTSLSGTAGQLS